MPMLSIMEKTKNITKSINSLFYGEDYQFKIYLISKKLYSLVTIFEQVSSKKNLAHYKIKYNNLLNYIYRQVKLLQGSNKFSRRLDKINENNSLLVKRQCILQLIISKILGFVSLIQKNSKILIIKPICNFTESIRAPLPKIEKSFFNFRKEELKSDDMLFSVSSTINEKNKL